ncbi:MAG: antibiotic biosynthesis monooxygenase [bacterium]|nr:antibiotic biosynthesis monooxygenase [bacterium]
MILRTWHGRTKRSDGDAYEAFMIDRAAPDYRRIRGLQQLYFTRRDDENVSHFLLVTLWSSLDAVREFAGARPDEAKYYPEDDRYLLEKAPNSHNHRVFLEDCVDASAGTSEA